MSNKDGIIELTVIDFEGFVTEHDDNLIYFFQPGMKGEEQIHLMFVGIGKKLHRMGYALPIAKVDMSKEKELIKGNLIEGDFAIRLFEKEGAIEYQGEMNEDKVFTWMEKKIRPVMVQLTDMAGIERENEREISVVFFLSENDEEAFKRLNTVAGQYSDIYFSYCFDNELKKQYDSGDSRFTVLVMKNFKNGNKVKGYTNLPSDKEIKSFINSVSYSIVLEFRESIVTKLFENDKPILILFTDESDNEAEYGELMEFALNNKERCIYSRARFHTDIGGKFAEYLEVKQENLPEARLMYFSDDGMNKYKLDSLTYKAFEQTLLNFENGRLNPLRVSEQVPLSNDGPVKKVVGHTFNELVMDNDHFVLLEVCLSATEECKEIAKLIDEVGEKLKNKENLIIGRIDMSVNEIDEFQFDEYPSILLFRPNQKESPLIYDDEHGVNEYIEFVEEYMEEQAEILSEDL